MSNNNNNKGLKELVKSGELAASEAQKRLHASAAIEDKFYVTQTRTWNWLCNKIKTQK